ncbi:MAG: response regulator transcription factor [Rhizobiales bacterium]|nr:response regulator transcription factor [Hyphomicrobiales bacterium]
MTLHRFVVADDHPLLRGALRQALEDMLDSVEIAEAASFEEVVEAVGQSGEPDLVLLDLNMPGTEGFSGLIFLRAQFPAVPVVIVSASDDRTVIRRSLEFGASGFIPKSVGIEQIRAALQEILNGEVWVPEDIDLNLEMDEDSEPARIAARLATLTPQQVRVLMMLNRGLLNKQIAFELDVSEATVKAHVSPILQKLGVDSRTQAVIALSRVDIGSAASAPATQLD